MRLWWDCRRKNRRIKSERVGNPPSRPPPLWSNPKAPFNVPIWLIFTPEEVFSTPFYTHRDTIFFRDCRPLTLYPFQTQTSYYFTYKTRLVVFDTLERSIVTSALLISFLPTRSAPLFNQNSLIKHPGPDGHINMRKYRVCGVIMKCHYHASRHRPKEQCVYSLTVKLSDLTNAVISGIRQGDNLLETLNDSNPGPCFTQTHTTIC